MSTDRLAAALFHPRSVALVGASGDLAKTSSRPQIYLRQHGFDGVLYPVNRGRAEVLGEKAYPSVAAIGQPIEHAFIMSQADDIPAILADCGKAGVICATILSDGYSEAGPEGHARQRDMLEAARQAGVRILGPNSIGVISPAYHLGLSANAALSAKQLLGGRIGVVSQSGSAIGMLLSRAHERRIGFSTLVSTGNESDLSAGEIASMLVDDPATDTILLFLETVRDGDKLAAAARSAFARGKAVIAYLLGRSAVGQALSTSHTGALATDHVAVDAFLRDCGILRVDMLETLFELPALVAGRKPPDGCRVNIVTTTGGGGAMVADRLGTYGIEVAPPSDLTVKKLAARGVTIRKAPMIDLTLAGTRKDIYGAVLDELCAATDGDLVLAVVGSSAQYHPEHAVEPILAQRKSAKPIAAFLTPCATESLALLGAAGQAAFRTPEACADAIRAFLEWRAPRKGVVIPAATVTGQSRILNERDSALMLEKLGVPMVASQVAASVAELQNLDNPVLYPAALKILSPDIAHKTEAGGIALGLADAAQLAEAGKAMLERVKTVYPMAQIDGFLVQPMRKGLGEALIGYRKVPGIGPLVTVAAGGILVDLYKDFACAIAPVSLETAREMVGSVKGFATLNGYRNLPKGDCEALARAIVAFSQIALMPEVNEAEANPVMVMAEGQGVIAVDALVMIA